MKSISVEGLRFLVGGAVNTVASYGLYLVVLPFAPYVVAFCVSFAAGVLVAFVVNSRFVFRTPLVWRKLGGMSAIYVAQALIGLVLLTALVELGGVDKRIAPLLNVMVLAPVTFLSSRWLLVNKGLTHETRRE